MWKKYSSFTNNINNNAKTQVTLNYQANKTITQSLGVSNNNSHKNSLKKLNGISWKI